jgi:hypothetical protein
LELNVCVSVPTRFEHCAAPNDGDGDARDVLPLHLGLHELVDARSEVVLRRRGAKQHGGQREDTRHGRKRARSGYAVTDHL